MISLKDLIGSELEKIEGLNDSITTGYPQQWSKFPIVVYQEETNQPHTITDNEEQLTTIGYKIDIWTKKTSTTSFSLEIDKVMTGLGFRRTNAVDQDEPNGLRHKVMRYRAVVSTDEKYIYHK